MKPHSLLCLLLALNVAPAAAQLVLPEAFTPVKASSPGPEAQARQAVRVDVEQLAALGEGADFLLPGREEPTPVTDVRHRRDAQGRLVWTARVQTAAGPQSAVLVAGEGGSFGLIPQPKGAPLRLETRHGQGWIVDDKSTPLPTRDDDFQLPPLPDAASRALRKQQDEQLAAGEPVVDVLVLYTPTLARVWGSTAAVETRIAYLEALSNQAYVDSDAAIRVRVVASHLLAYLANDDNSTALRAITDPSDLPVKLEVDRLRALYGADLVKLFRNFDRVAQNSCGNGWLGGYHGSAFNPDYGFSETSDHGFGGDNCSEFTFTHELGHNMGAHHDEQTAGGDYGAYLYSRGYRQTIDASSGFATIMAYPTGPQTRLGRVSNPRQSLCLGLPCGDAERADNARAFSEAAAAIAGLVPAVAETGPAVQVGDASVTEGNAGVRSVTFPITLSAPSATPVTLSLAIRHGSTDIADLSERTATLQIAAGQTSSSFSADVRGDTAPEFDEFFSLEILSANGARIADGQGVATILNDDPLPALSLDDIRVGEGNGNDTVAVFTATISQASTQPVRFDIATGEYGGSNVAREYEDFTPVTRQGITIPPGETQVQFQVPLVGDTTPEPSERFYVAVGGVVGATISDVIIRADIIDDDGGAELPTLSLVDAEVSEGSSGPRTVQAQYTLSAPTAQQASFVVMGVPGTATSPADFVLAPTVISVPAGQSTGSIALQVSGDTVDEADETLRLVAFNLVGTRPGKPYADITLLDDDGTADTPPMVARDDRAIVPENANSFQIDVLGNDAIDAARLAGGSVVISEGASAGSLVVDNRGTPANASDDVLRFTPPADWSGDVLGAYRACESGGRCSEAAVLLTVRPHPGVEIDSPTGGGYVDIPISGMRALPDARFSMVAPQTEVARVRETLPQDPTPEYPWDLGQAGTYVRLVNPAFYEGTNRLLADARAGGSGDVDLYLGLDDDGDGVADPQEVRCTSASSAGLESCEISVDLETLPAGLRPWIAVHNRSASTIEAEAELYVLPLALDQAFSAQATGPGHVERGAAFPLRVHWSWTTQSTLQRFASLAVLRAQPGGTPVYVPVRVSRSRVEHRPLAVSPRASEPPFLLAAGGTHDRVYVDVPVNVSTLRVDVNMSGPVDIHLVRADAAAGSEVPPAPPLGTASASRTNVSGSATLTLSSPTLSPGRWYVVVVNRSATDATVGVNVSFGLPSSLNLAYGSYFNPDRSGHGLFLYPAGNQIAGLWYTYLQDGTSTWYYLQGGRSSSGVWRPEIYRAAWNGSSNHLTDVGTGLVTPTEDGGLTFSYLLDGQAGAETLQPLGTGCPMLNGQPLDASSHWFNPATAGTGYSVQLFPDYEFYAAFVYDGLGVPRFLTAEAGSFRGADATMPLEQLTGFCPLCERTGAPQRADVGTLRRRFDASGLVRMELDAIYTNGVPGTWTADDAVQLLGGPGTAQGCQVP